MKPKCPYCGGPINRDRLLIPKMPKRHRNIYEAVIAAGPDGIPPEDLVVAMFKPKQPTPSGAGVLRVKISELNKILHDMNVKIIAKPYGSYRLVSIDDQAQ